ncbi:low molecular weight phosphatase family protein [Chloroflexota bacterium]
MMTILFVCVHNSGRSQMAEAFFNSLAGGKAEAVSAGTDPADELNPVVVEAMREAGIDISNRRPKLLTLEMAEKADRMITMGCGAEAGDIYPASFVETEDWQLDDPKGQSIEKVRQIKDWIRGKVLELLKEIDKNNE